MTSAARIAAPPETIGGLIEAAAARFGSAEALVDDGVRWTFARLSDEANRAGRALMASGVGPGERVGIWAPNIWEWVVAALGTYAAGAAAVPVNTRFKGAEAAYVLDRAGARLLFTVTDFLGADYAGMLDRAGRPPALGEIVVMRGAVGGAVGFADFLARADEADEAERAARAAAVTPGDVCHVMFTSGTTGKPKGAMLAHGAVCRTYRSWSEVVGLRQGDRYLIVNPFFHSFGLQAGILACLITGAAMIPHPVFDVASVMERIPVERVTMLPGPPAIYRMILDHPDLETFDMSTLRLAVTGAAPVPVSLISEMRARLGFETVLTGYGLTESTGVATMCRHDDPPEVVSATSGRAIDGVEVKVAEPDGAEAPRGSPGEILVRGYNVMAGYIDDPEATAEAVDADGWLHTGDVGVMDAAGYIDITDRIKDVFITGGFNVYPAEVEEMMLDHPGIGQAAVVGVGDRRLGEVGYAFVVPAPGAEPSELAGGAVEAWCRERMANYKAPRHVELIDELPRNPSGKVLKYELRQRAAAALAD